MKIHFIHVGLPKSGTSFMEGLLNQVENVSTGKLKEPTYVDLSNSDYDNSTYLNNVIASGNHSKGIDWYKDTFSNKSITFDLSTQYWINTPTINLENINIIKFAIYRDPIDQIKSYIGHLRRGYLPDLPLDVLFENDSDFKRYIVDMYKYGKSLQYENNRNDILIINFEDLITNPQLVIDKLIMSYEPEYKSKPLNLNVNKNKKGTPKIKILNKFIMNRNYNNFIKRLIPNIFYSSLINLRKLIINSNLDTNHINDGKFNKRDDETLELLFR